jgi:glycosyltransferase involved in cell wall biosynthesis
MFPPGNSEELAARIRELWQDPALGKEMGMRGKRFVEDELDEKRHVDELETVYRRAASAR